jgi:hypothetical protein
MLKYVAIIMVVQQGSILTIKFGVFIRKYLKM